MLDPSRTVGPGAHGRVIFVKEPIKESEDISEGPKNRLLVARSELDVLLPWHSAWLLRSSAALKSGLRCGLAV